VGKGTLIKEMMRRYPRLKLSVSATTRKPRPGERNGVDYHFMDRETFREMIEQGRFLEWAVVHGSYYGTPEREVREMLDRGLDVVLEIDVQGARQVKNKVPEAVTVFILPPSLEVLEKRLRERGTEDERDLKRRLENAVKEKEERGFFDYEVVNDELSRAVQEVCAIYEKETIAGNGGGSAAGR
jgi:guanylate kinase